MLSNWTKATTDTTGTGTITLSAVSGRPLPSAAHAVGEYVQYSINTSDGKFEAGIGQIAATNTLVRSRVTATYDGSTYNKTTASALTLSGTGHTVFITPVASMVYEPLKAPFTTPSSETVFSTHIVSAESNVTIAAAAKRNTAWPFRLETSGVITSFAVYCSTAVASSTVLVGLYSARPSDGAPGELIVKASSTFDTSSTGYKTQSATANTRINPGWYWAACCVTSTTSVPQFTGGTTVRNAFGADGKVSVLNVREDATATDLADPFPSTSLYVESHATNGTPLIGLVMA
jgi:hypothetical protein